MITPRAGVNKLLIFDFIYQSKTTAEAKTVFLMPGDQSLNAVLWADKSVIAVSVKDADLTAIYKIPRSTQPYSDLCNTCHEVFKKRCTSCQPNSSQIGKTCSCDEGYFETKLSFTRRQCSLCSGPCKRCSGPGPTDCTSCKDDNKEVKGGRQLWL